MPKPNIGEFIALAKLSAAAVAGSLSTNNEVTVAEAFKKTLAVALEEFHKV